MTSFRALAMGAFIGFVAAMVPSCVPATCDANTCAGCCDSAKKCVATPGNQSDATCGAQGNACVDCAKSGKTCSGTTFSCVGGAGGGTGGNCLGCLTANGDCAPGVTDAICGTNGAACEACASGQSCVGGSCGTGASVGAGCTSDTDCGLAQTALDRQYQIRGFCKKESLDLLGQGGFAYPAGYCTKRCAFEDNSCGAGNVCVYLLGFIGEYENQCMKLCTDTPDCRGGYGCVSLDSSTKVCLPFRADGGLPLVVDAGPGFPAAAGPACATAAQCRPPSSGFCFLESLSDGGPSGFAGGACSADCGAVAYLASANEWCGTGGVCNPYGFSTNEGLGPIVLWQCDRGCGAGWDAGCRSGYVCDPATVGPGACVPDCHNPGVRCSTGTNCSDTSGLCE